MSGNLGFNPASVGGQEALWLQRGQTYKFDLSEDSKNKIYSNPLRILDSKNKRDIDLSNNSPKIEKLYTTSAKQKFDEVQILLSKSNKTYCK